MISFENIAKLSPLPIIDLDNMAMPNDGIVISLNETCRRYFKNNNKCKEFYQNIAHSDVMGKIVQCPAGFSCFATSLANSRVAFIGFIPHPRMGGARERELAKKHSDVKIQADYVAKIAANIMITIEDFVKIEFDILKRNSSALHEIRKLNRNIKQTAERRCRELEPTNPDAADTRLVKIWKTSEIMSHQFDVIELLANRDLTQLPLNSSIELYKLIDKCFRIYASADVDDRMNLHCTPGYHPVILACDKTLPIIPTVLIENALKYSIPDTAIRVNVMQDNSCCLFSVTNKCYNKNLPDKTVFEGVRFSPNIEGSGYGLFLASLVAKQHNATIELKTRPGNSGIANCEFIVKFKTIN
jgi:signal transduction histidine kinase